MLIDRSHRAWALFSLISLTAATIAWTVSLKYSPAGASGGSFSGLLFGILGTAMMLFAGLLAGRRPLRHLPLGSARFWMKGHLWLGTLCIPFILFHSGFAWGGVLEQLLWYCLAFVALSGFFGLAVQQFLPGLLWRSVPLETFEPQAPWLCDRLTLVNDTKLSALCERQLDAPSPHLQEPAKRTVAAYQKLMDGPGARNEKNARKLLLLQEVAPPAVRDFFWAMAKYSRTELKAIGFDGDFPELLGRLYSDLRPPTVPSDAESPAAAQLVQPVTAPPAAPLESAAPAITKPSPLDAMRQKAAAKAAAASVGGAAAGPSETSAGELSEPAVSASAASPGAAAVKLSPLEQMRQQAALKAAAASGGAGGTASSETSAVASPEPTVSVATASPGAAAVKLSPLEQMRQQAALKAAAASGDAGGAASSETSAVAPPGSTVSAATASAAAAAVKLSPLEQMRQQAALKAAAASGGAGGAGSSETSAVASPEPTVSAATASPGAAAVKLSPLEQMRQQAALKATAASGGAGGAAPSETSAAASPQPTPVAAPAAPASTPSASAVRPQVTAGPAAGKPPTPPLKSPGDGSAGGRQPPTESAPPISLSPDEKGVLWDFYVNQVRPYLMEHGSGGLVRRSRFATEMGAQRVFREQKALLPKSLHAVLDELYGSVEVRRQLEQQRRVLRWMHWWLMLHVPVSILLLVFLAAHVLMALRVVPLQF